MRIFGTVQSESESTSQFQYIIIFQRLQSFKAPSSTPGDMDICADWFFCIKFNSQQLLFEQFLDIVGNFGSVQPESESTFPFQWNIMFRDI